MTQTLKTGKVSQTKRQKCAVWEIFCLKEDKQITAGVALGYGSSSPALSNRERFPTFFRTHPSATLHNPTRVKLFKKFGWTQIATIQETQEVFTSTVEDLEERVKQANIAVSVRQNFLTDPANAVRNLKRQDARIIVGVFYENMARKVFCQAYKEKLYGKKYVWFIIGWYPDNWYKKYDPKINCTADQLKEALEGHFATEAVVLHQENTATLSHMTSQEFKDRLDLNLKERYNFTDMSQVDGYPEAPFAYDAVWALALALNRTSMKLSKYNKKLEDFNYYSEDIRREIYSAMNDTSFLGVSGNVAFSSEGDRIAWTQIEQMSNGTYQKLGFYDYNTDNLTWIKKEKWIGGKVPPDHTLIKSAPRVVSHGLFFAMCFFAAFGIAFGIFCIMFNFLNRQRRCIAYSQPSVNNVTVFGCILCLMCILLLGLDNQFISPELYPLICQLRAWMLSLGFTFAYGGMFSKIWTVHRLTTANKKDRKVVRWCELFTVLSVILTIDIAVLTTWQVLDPLYREVEIFEKEDPVDTDEDIKLQPELEHCTSKNISIWLGVIYGYKGILLLFGIFLAYETRSVKLKQVNDSRFVGMSIYNVVVLCVITAPITLIISNQQDASFAFVALAILLCSFLSMGLIFVPKIVEISRNPKKNHLEVRAMSESVASKEEEERHQRLLIENEGLKKQISEMEDRVKELKEKLERKTQQRLLINGDGPERNKVTPTNKTDQSQLDSDVDKSPDLHDIIDHKNIFSDNMSVPFQPNSDSNSSMQKNLHYSISDQDIEFL
ncbi:gamma-aminobutyric acid type B receptor subunit 1-like isoform X3 [Argopecten irradians]|uniref:gamma-aminobutyric acid type B receptor subunit 1-like isoform X3 n=1 Tax=Argopecten irradians TaxID=31199 RepID=UPI00370FE554